MARMHLQAGDFEAASRDAQAVLDARPRDYQANYVLGSGYLGLGRVDAAKRVFEELVGIAPDNPAG